MKTTRYFDITRQREDRRTILDEWISQAVTYPAGELVQADSRIRRWALIEAAGHR